MVTRQILITLRVSTELLARMEAAAKANYCSRSDYIRSAVVTRLNQQQITAPPAEPEEPPIPEQSEEEFLKEPTERYTKTRND